MKKILGLLRKIANLLVLGWGRTPVTWIWRQPKDSWDKINIHVSTILHPQQKSLKIPIIHWGLYTYMLLIWPFRVLSLTTINTLSYGAKTKEKYGIGYFNQVIQQLDMGILKGLNPELYYKFELFDTSRLLEARYYLTGNVASVLFDSLNKINGNDLLDDKIATANILQQFGIPTVSTFASVIKGKIRDSEGNPVDPPSSDFIAKPNQGMQGQGVYRFEYADGSWNCSNLKSYDLVEVKAFLCSLSQQEPFILQPRLVNHPNLLDLTNKGFSTVRVISALNKANEIEFIIAVFKMPTGEGVADNFMAGGIAAPVEIKSGRLGLAVSKKLLTERLERHPDTGAQINGRLLPHWDELLACVSKAHKCFGEYVFLGWDVGITQNGPVILEANANWCVELAQRPSLYPLGRSHITDIAVDRLLNSSTT